MEKENSVKRIHWVDEDSVKESEKTRKDRHEHTQTEDRKDELDGLGGYLASDEHLRSRKQRFCRGDR